MAAQNRKPLGLMTKHLTKAEREIKARKTVTAKFENAEPPAWCSAAQKREFWMIAGQLVEIGIMGDVDCDAIGLYIKAKDDYIAYDKTLKKLRKDSTSISTAVQMADAVAKYDTMRDKAFKRCLAAARELGLTISSRCKLVMPKADKPEEQPTGMEAFLNGRAGA